MKQFDNIEEYLTKHKEQFLDEEPSFGHFNRFSKKLDAIHEEEKPNNNLLQDHRKAILIAASVALVALISVPLMNLNFPNAFSASQIDAVDEQLSSSIRESLKSNVLQASFENDAAFEATLAEITSLEMEYVKLKHEYNSTNHCNNVLASMKGNLEARLAILDCLNRQEGRKVDTAPFVHENYLLKHISDCYEEPVIETSTEQYTSVNY